ncbi:MAG TPA: hypothetical protein VMZ27_06320 [Candidatus Saccharimonadales bacterium]|nr:hypothetical protein [Candidatus Saccharimonadales bacterium]
MKCLCLTLALLALVLARSHAAPKVDERQQQAIETLRKELAKTNQVAAGGSKTKGAGQVTSNPATVPPKEPPSHAEMENLFLTGRISQKQYQAYLKQYPVDPRKTRPPSTTVETVKTPPVVAPVLPGTAPVAPVPNQEVDDSKKFDTVEAQIEAIIRQKEARDKALKNAPPDPEPKTKREKLNAVLKLYINEKITEQEYNQRRDKILAEPGD